ncbi:MAG TPA: hypothetical protein DCP46_02615 [Lachnospiraceae bacterium]|nr:hypothetical protein [Lachnospiraceae bacterium]
MDANDVELFSTTDIESKTKAVSVLVRNRISYLERWEKIPLLRRREYGGARELCVVYVNGNQYEKAKKILDEFNEEYFGPAGKRRRRRGRKEDTATSVADPGQSMQETVSSGGDDTDDEIDNI